MCLWLGPNEVGVKIHPVISFMHLKLIFQCDLVERMENSNASPPTQCYWVSKNLEGYFLIYCKTQFLLAGWLFVDEKGEGACALEYCAARQVD